jgi:hypothetical protein
VRSYISDFLGLRQDFEQFIIGQEIETGKDRSLSLKVIFQTILNKIKILIGFNELFFETFFTANKKNTWVLLGNIDLLFPSRVH